MSDQDDMTRFGIINIFVSNIYKFKLYLIDIPRVFCPRLLIFEMI